MVPDYNTVDKAKSLMEKRPQLARLLPRKRLMLLPELQTEPMRLQNQDRLIRLQQMEPLQTVPHQLMEPPQMEPQPQMALLLQTALQQLAELDNIRCTEYRLSSWQSAARWADGIFFVIGAYPAKFLLQKMTGRIWKPWKSR